MSSLEIDIIGDGKTSTGSSEGIINLDSDCEIELDNHLNEEVVL